jgi:hypothetical protein
MSAKMSGICSVIILHVRKMDIFLSILNCLEPSKFGQIPDECPEDAGSVPEYPVFVRNLYIIFRQFQKINTVWIPMYVRWLMYGIRYTLYIIHYRTLVTIHTLSQNWSIVVFSPYNLILYHKLFFLKKKKKGTFSPYQKIIHLFM